MTTQSSSRGQQLAKRLKDAGAKMYGAFWCSHCHEQKEAFGEQAMKDFPYVECYPDGFHKVQLNMLLFCSSAVNQIHVGDMLFYKMVRQPGVLGIKAAALTPARLSILLPHF